MLNSDNEKLLRELVGETLSEEEITKLIHELTDAEFLQRVETMQRDILSDEPTRSRFRRRP